MYENNIKISGRISSISDIHTTSSGKEFCYINIAQNGRDNKGRFYSVYLSDKQLEDFQNRNYKIGDPIRLVGRLDFYQKDGRNNYQIRPYEFLDIESSKESDITDTEQNLEL